MHSTRVLIVDSDPVIRRFMKSKLESRGYGVLLAIDGAEAIEIIENNLIDISLIDLVLRDASGIEVCRTIRKQSQVPIIIISAYDEKSEIECLNVGADAFLSDPFEIEEIVAHIEALFRRTGKKSYISQSTLSIGDLKIEFSKRRVIVANREIKLTPTEFNLLQELALNQNKVLTHENLLNRIWGPEYGQEREYLRVFISRLRKKLVPDPKGPNYILTVPWVGYKFRLDEQMNKLQLAGIYG